MSGEHILVVEDDAALLEGVRDILEFSGYRVSTATHGQEALAALEHSLPQLIISDIMMPKMDGYQLYAAVRARPEWLDVPFIFLTARGDKQDVRRGKELGADDYVIKPFDEEDLLVAIRNKLGRRAQLDEARQTQMNALKRSILTTLNHEFRTPLTHITAYIELLRDSNPGIQSEEFQSFLDAVRAGSERLQRLVEDFIQLVEFQTGESQRVFERRREPLFEIPMILHTVRLHHQERAAQRRVQLHVQVPAEPLPPVLADREFLTNAVSRLVDNAIKFSGRDGGAVTISACVDAEHVPIAVTDEGIGIPAAETERIFDLFYQIDRTKQEQQGTGSGLAIVREIVKMHGGQLAVTSQAGAGSTFTIRLPVFVPRPDSPGP
jgi:signal transduction histidine kinase